MIHIAAFDSGIGGLIALSPLIKSTKMPLSISYLGDLAHLPYGTKSPKRICDLARINIQGLLNLNRNLEGSVTPLDLLFVACNTVSAHALDEIKLLGNKFQNGLKCQGVIDPVCQQIVKSSQEAFSRIVVLATPATVTSQAYPRTLRKMGFAGEIMQIPTPLFVPLVEEGLENSSSADQKIDFYLKGKILPGDAIVLGCTHYPLLKPKLTAHFPKNFFFDAGSSFASSSEWLELVSSKRQNGDFGSNSTTLRVYLTDSTRTQEHIQNLLQKLGIKSDQVNLFVKSIEPFV